MPHIAMRLIYGRIRGHTAFTTCSLSLTGGQILSEVYHADLPCGDYRQIRLLCAEGSYF